MHRDVDDDDVLRELTHHLELAQAEHVRAGVAPHEAYRLARISFGGVLQTKEACLEAAQVASPGRRLTHRVLAIYRYLTSTE